MEWLCVYSNKTSTTTTIIVSHCIALYRIVLCCIENKLNQCSAILAQFNQANHLNGCSMGVFHSFWNLWVENQSLIENSIRTGEWRWLRGDDYINEKMMNIQFFLIFFLLRTHWVSHCPFMCKTIAFKLSIFLKKTFKLSNFSKYTLLRDFYARNRWMC